MKKQIIFSFIFLLIIFSCDSQTKNNQDQATVSDSSSLKKKKTVYNEKISFSDSAKANYKPDSMLNYADHSLICDSAIILEYSDGQGRRYPAINKEGQWINTISIRKKLKESQIQYIEDVLGNPKSFENPDGVGCYFPSIAILYYKNNLIIGQTLICLSCEKVESTAKLANQKHYSPFNLSTLRQLEKLCIELEFPHCKFWKDRKE